MLKAGGCRSSSTCSGRAKEEHIFLGFPWRDELHLAVRESSASITRRMGPARHSSPWDFADVWRLEMRWLSQVSCPPLQEKYLIIAGSFFCTREIESSLWLYGDMWNSIKTSIALLGHGRAPRRTLKPLGRLVLGSACAPRLR